MKNREKFAKEILDVACTGDSFMVTKSGKITFCDIFKCDMCKFNDSTGEKGCRTKRYEWSESEYVEKPTITLREKAFLDLLLPEWKYIARDNKDNDAMLYVFKRKPIKQTITWCIKDPIMYDYNNISNKLFGDMFDFIKWEDEEPWSIEDLKNLKVRDDGKAND